MEKWLQGTDVNWVVRQARCRTEDIFDCVYRRFEKDVETMNEELGNKYFEVSTINGRSKAFVSPVPIPRETGAQDPQQVQLSIRGEGDLLVQDGRGLRFIITCKWIEDTATCQLYIDSKAAELWQISQKALFGLFFNPSR